MCLLKKSISLILFISSLMFLQQAKATGIVGSHVGYKAIDSVTYEIILTLYKECGTHPDTARIEIRGKSTGLFTSLAKRVSVTDITGAYLSCNFKSKCNGGTTYGFDKIIYKDTVNISGGACEYIFGYEGPARNSSITTGAGGTVHYNYALVNKCFGMNTSLQADLEPRLLIPVRQDVLMSTFLGDTIDKTDSVAYELADIYSSSTNKVPYTSFYSAQRPFSYLGFPNPGLNLPAGFHFDKQTSNLKFRPTKQSQVTVFCIEAKEYRKVNGKMEVVGTTRLENTVRVVPAPNNKTPTISGQSAIACANQKTCINFETDDGDKKDTTYLNVISLPTGATVTYGRKGRLATAQVCFTPTNSQIRNNPYSFTVFVSNYTCVIRGRNRCTFTFTAKKPLDSTHIEVLSKTANCGSANIILNLKNTAGLAGLSLEVYDEDSISNSTNDTARLFFKGSGWKKFFVHIKATNTPCTYTLTDSVFIAPQYRLQFNTKSDTSICGNDSIEIFAYPLNGVAPYTYSWREVSQSASPFEVAATTIFKTTVNKNKTYQAFIVDSNYCIGYTDTVFITANPLPNIAILPIGIYCESANSISLNTKVTPIGGVWSGQGIINDSTFSPQTATIGVHTISYLFEDTTTGCQNVATTQATISKQPKADFTALKTIGLPNDTIDFINTTPNASSLSTRWDMGDFGKTNNIQLTPNASYKYTDTGKYTVKLWVNDSICPPDSLTKTNYIKIGSYYLSSKSVSKLVVKLYPNPASKSITIEADGDIEHIYIYDVTGKKISSRQLKDNIKIVSINVSQFLQGIYIVEIRLKNGLYLTQKMGVNK